MDLQACIFDLDGVIVDTAKYHFMAWKRLADELMIPFTREDNERLKGVSRTDSLEIILELGKMKVAPAMKKQYASLKNEWYLDYIKSMTPEELLPGSLEFIRELKDNQIKIAIGSASKNTPAILKSLGLDSSFDVVVDGNIVKKAKPDPEVFTKAAEMLGVLPEGCVVFEDAIAGVKSALNAGMICIGIGSENILKEAHYVVSGLDKMNLNKLRKIVKSIRV